MEFETLKSAVAGPSGDYVAKIKLVWEMILALFINSRNSSLLLQNGSMAHIPYNDAIVKYFVGENPIFLEYCTPISEPVPFFEAAQGIIGCSG